MEWEPMYDKVIIKPNNIQEVKSETGLVYENNMSLSKNTTLQGVVVAVGRGRLLQDGRILPPVVRVGDTVYVSKITGESFEQDSMEYIILSESNILAIKKRQG